MTGYNLWSIKSVDKIQKVLIERWGGGGRVNSRTKLQNNYS